MSSSSLGEQTEILFATDFCEPSQRALLYVKKLALVRKAAVRSIHVIDLTDGAGTRHRSFSAARQSAERRLREVRRELRLAGIQETAALISGGKPADAILEAAAQYRLGILAIGVNGASSAKSSSLGRTARVLLQKARWPVLTVGAGCAAHTKTAPTGKQLFVTDAAPESLRAARMAWPVPQNDEPASIYTVLPPACPELPGWIDSFFDPIRLLQHDGAAEMILSHARDLSIDWVVASLRKSAYLDSFARHRFAHTLLTKAPCPVLWVRG